MTLIIAVLVSVLVYNWHHGWSTEVEKLKEERDDFKIHLEVTQQKLERERFDHEQKLDEILEENTKKLDEEKSKTTEIQIQQVLFSERFTACNRDKDYLTGDVVQERKARSNCTETLTKCNYDLATCRGNCQNINTEKERLERAKENVMDNLDGCKDLLRQCNINIESYRQQEKEFASKRMSLQVEIEKYKGKEDKCISKLEDMERNYDKCQKETQRKRGCWLF